MSSQTRNKPAIRAANDRKYSFPVTTVVIFIAVLAAYWPALRGAFIWDDDFYVSNNQTLRSLNGLYQIWFEIGATPQYYPLVFTSYWLEYHLWGLSTIGYHTVNVLLHAASAILAWRIVRRLEVPGALLAGLIFALHPVHVESVAWITERKNVLSGFFYLLSMLAFLRYSPFDERSKPHVRWYAASFFCFVAALLSKTVTSTLPAALLLIYWFKLGRLRRRDVLAVLPMFLIGATAGLVTAWIEKHHVGTRFLVFDLGWLDRIVLAGRIIWFYLSKLVWPDPLIFIYPRWNVSAADVSQWLYPATLLLILTLLAILRKKIGRGPLVAALFFGGTLFPALGFVDVYPMRYSFVADHFQYLASLGPIVLISAVIVRCVPARAAIVTGALVLLLLSGLSMRQCFAYQDVEALWRDTLAKDPKSSMALNNLGSVLQARGNLQDADHYFKAALALPECQDRGRVLFNLATTARQRGEITQAIEYYQQAITNQPNFPKALVNLAGILQGQGRIQEAIDRLNEAIRYYPDYLLAHNNLGSVLLDAHRPQDAIEHLQIAIKLDPSFALAHYNLANAYARLDRPADAEAEYRKAIELNPRHADAHVNIASLLMKGGHAEQAAAHLTIALQIDPTDAGAHHALGNALARLGRRTEALEHYRIAQQIRPDPRPMPGRDTP